MDLMSDEIFDGCEWLQVDRRADEHESLEDNLKSGGSWVFRGN